jgi:hypothetical protein
MPFSLKSAAPPGDPPSHGTCVGVVGPCAAGKTTLISALRQRGYPTRHIAQEHSGVKDMWLRLVNPDVLIYLQVSYPLTCIRRKIDWTEAEYEEQLHRLEHARQHADLILDTDKLSAEQVLGVVLDYLQQYENQSK